MGECPGASRTLPREFGVATAPFGDSAELTRCWLLAGIPLFGSGPFDGIRSEDVELGGSIEAGRAGGGMRPLPPGVLDGPDVRDDGSTR